MANYDAYFPTFLAKYGIPGVAVAVSKDGRLVYARGFGTADVEAGMPVQPTSRFRVASLSKPITAVVTMALVERGLLALDDAAFPYLDDLPVPEGQTEDARLAQVTIPDLLQHSGGWNRDGTGYDPMFDAVHIAQAMGVDSPPSTETIIRYMRGRPLDFSPGTTYAYSNFGYAVLGEVLEHVSETPYEQLVQGVLADAGIDGMALAGSLLADRLPGEVRYYPTTDRAPSVFDGSTAPWPYGGFSIEAMAAHGGWVASAPDLLRLTTALDGLDNRPDLLTSESMAAMSDRPPLSVWNGAASWYGLGWSVNTNGHWWHTGSIPGSESLLVRSSYNGLHWAVLFNARPAQGWGALADLDNAMWTLALGVQTWPTHDLFATTVDAEDGPTDGLTLAVAPNPIRRAATVRLTLDAAARVRVDVVDALGRQVHSLHDGDLPAGTHTLVLDADGLPSGVYLVRAIMPGARLAQRVTTVQ